jgi:hypothetical protein
VTDKRGAWKPRQAQAEHARSREAHGSHALSLKMHRRDLRHLKIALTGVFFQLVRKKKTNLIYNLQFT